MVIAGQVHKTVIKLEPSRRLQTLKLIFNAENLTNVYYMDHTEIRPSHDE